MTLVVTHANGFLGCFTKESDGSMRQRALIDTGDGPPTPEMLATVGDALDGQWGWSMPALPAAKAKKPKALPPAPEHRKTKGQKQAFAYRDGHPTDPKPAERPALVLAHLIQTPYQTTAEILTGLGMEPTTPRQSRWHHVFRKMLEAKMIARRKRPDKNGTKYEYWALVS